MSFIFFGIVFKKVHFLLPLTTTFILPMMFFILEINCIPLSKAILHSKVGGEGALLRGMQLITFEFVYCRSYLTSFGTGFQKMQIVLFDVSLFLFTVFFRDLKILNFYNKTPKFVFLMVFSAPQARISRCPQYKLILTELCFIFQIIPNFSLKKTLPLPYTQDNKLIAKGVKGAEQIVCVRCR